MGRSLAYRPADAEDAPLVVASWLKSFRLAHAAGLIAMADWARVMTPQLQRVLSRPAAMTWVAHHPGELDRGADLYGWICVERTEGERPLVHYVYVKHAYRRMGIATGLLAAAGLEPDDAFEFTCRTAVTSKLPIPRARWQPLRARFDRPKTKPRT